MDYIKTNEFLAYAKPWSRFSMFESLCSTDLHKLSGTPSLKKNISQKALNALNTICLVLKIILPTLLIFFDLKNRTQKHQLSEVRILRVNHLVRRARLFGLMTCNSRFVLSYLGFFLGFPSKMSHCVAFECSNQAKTKRNPRLPFSSFPKDHIQLTTCMDSC